MIDFFKLFCMVAAMSLAAACDNQPDAIEDANYNREHAETTDEGAGSDYISGELTPEEVGASKEHLTGTYIQATAATVACQCNCLDIRFDQPTELCLVPDQLSVSVNYELDASGRILLYLVDPIRRPSGSDLAWQAFSREAPIAVLSSPARDGQLELNWLGLTREDTVDEDSREMGQALEGLYVKRTEE